MTKFLLDTWVQKCHTALKKKKNQVQHSSSRVAMLRSTHYGSPLRHPQKIAQSRKFGRVLPFPVYRSYSLIVYCLGQDVYSKSGVPSPNPCTPLHALTNSGKVTRFSGHLTTTCLLFQRSAIFQEPLHGRAWLLASCPTCYQWPLFLFQKSHHQDLALTFFNTSYCTFTYSGTNIDKQLAV